MLVRFTERTDGEISRCLGKSHEVLDGGVRKERAAFQNGKVTARSQDVGHDQRQSRTGAAPEGRHPQFVDKCVERKGLAGRAPSRDLAPHRLPSGGAVGLVNPNVPQESAAWTRESRNSARYMVNSCGTCLRQMSVSGSISGSPTSRIFVSGSSPG